MALCLKCGKNLALVGRAHLCRGRLPARAPSIKVPVTNSPNRAAGKVTNNVTNADRPTSTARVMRWKKAHRRSWNEYMKFYMRDWRCRQAVIKGSE
jgi:hypothetical protein